MPQSSSSVNLNVTVSRSGNGTDSAAITPVTVNLSGDFPKQNPNDPTVAKFTSPCTLVFTIQDSGAQNEPYTFLTTDEDPMCGVHLTDTEGNHAPNTEFSISSRTDNQLNVSDANTGGDTYTYYINIKDKNGSVLKADPSIVNRR